MMNNKLILATVFFLFTSSNVFGDTITLNNGRKIEGNIISEDDESITVNVVLNNQLTGATISFLKKEISDIDSSHQYTQLERDTLTPQEKEAIEQKTIERLKKNREVLDELAREKQDEIFKEKQERYNNNVKKQEYQFSTIKSKEVKKAHLEIFNELGSFNGYIVFYDENGNQSAVKGYYSFPAKLYIGEKHFVKSNKKKKEFYIVPEEFKVMQLRNGTTIYAYPIEPFVIEENKLKEIEFSFEWEGIKTQTVVYLE